MSKSFSAIKYSRGLQLDTILKAEGDMINVFVPVAYFTLDNPVFCGQLVYGRRPYSVKSDLVAILGHMGILFPVEKQKKNTPEMLYTSPNALLFGKKDIDFDEKRKIADDFRFFGVVVTVTAVEPIEHFQSVTGFGLQSQATHDLSFIALDIINYTFISEFEPMPTLVDDPESIIRHFSKADFFMPEDTEKMLVYQYSPDLFADDTEGFLFQDYNFSFMMNDIQLNFKCTRNGFVLTRKMAGDPSDTETSLIEADIQFKDISFTKTGIKVKDVTYEPISRFTVEKIDNYEY
jgi:hypothetical protein